MLDLQKLWCVSCCSLIYNTCIAIYGVVRWNTGKLWDNKTNLQNTIIIHKFQYTFVKTHRVYNTKIELPGSSVHGILHVRILEWLLC